MLYLFELTFQFFWRVLQQYTLKMSNFTISCIFYLYEYFWHSMNLKYLFLWTFFLSFLHSSGQHYESHVIFWNRLLYIHHIFSPGLIFDFLITVIIFTNFVYEQYMIKLNYFWCRYYVMDYMYKYLLSGIMLFCSKLKNCIIL